MNEFHEAPAKAAACSLHCREIFEATVAPRFDPKLFFACVFPPDHWEYTNLQAICVRNCFVAALQKIENHLSDCHVAPWDPRESTRSTGRQILEHMDINWFPRYLADLRLRRRLVFVFRRRGCRQSRPASSSFGCCAALRGCIVIAGRSSFSATVFIHLDQLF